MIIGINGKKQSGKSSLANFWIGMELCRLGEFPYFQLNQGGRLVVPAQEDDGNIVNALIDIDSRDPEFMEWAANVYWPSVKNYAFADSLKDVCMNLFGLTYAQCYGTDEDKNSPVEHIKWENIPGAKGKKGTITAREFMQYFGTEICRKIHNPVWVDCCLNQIEKEQPDVAIITDCRFLNEVKSVQERGGKVIRLTRCVSEDSHASETDCDNYDKFDAVIDNKEMTMGESQDAFVKIMKDWGLFKNAEPAA